jgi:hypothetical protein
MPGDVERLMKEVGWGQREYREVAAEEHDQNAGGGWPLLVAVNRRLALAGERRDRSAEHDGAADGRKR